MTKAKSNAKAKVTPRAVNHARTLVADLLSGRRTPANALLALKQLDDIAAVRHFFEKAGHIPAIRTAMLGPTRASNYTDFGKHPNPNLPVGSLAVELLFAAHALSFRAAEIAEFSARRLNFERALLRGDADESAEQLSQIEQNHGKSLWLLESEILRKLMQLDAVEDADAAIERMVAEVRGNLHPFLILCTLSLRGQRSDSGAQTHILSYIHQLAKKLSKVPKETLAWWTLRTYPAGLINQNEAQLVAFLREESSLPIVDRYLAFRRILMILAATEVTPQIRHAIHAAVTVLAAFVDEPWIAAVRGAIGPRGPARSDDAAPLLLRCLDLYTLGDYTACLYETRLACEAHPSRLDFYELYVRSSIRTGAPWEPLGAPKSLVRDIGDALYSVWQWSDDTLAAIETLELYADMLTCLHLGEQLFRLLPTSSSFRSDLSEFFHLVACPFPTPRIPLFFGDPQTARTLLRDLRAQFSGSATLDAYTAALSPDEPDTPAVPRERMAKLRALVALADARHADACKHLDELSAADLSVVDRQEVTLIQLQTYLELDWLEECVSLIARTYVECAPMLVSLPLREVLKKLSPTRLSAAPGIDAPLALLAIQAYSQEAVDPYRIYVAHDEFLQSRNCQRPTQLRQHYAPDSLALAEDLPRLVAFLRDACTPQVMDDSPVYKNQTDLENERIEVCGWLGDLDPSNKPRYEDERVELVKTQTIRQAIRQVERSKVYVDIEGIRRTHAKQLTEDFARIQSTSRVEDTLRRLDVRGGDGVFAKIRLRMILPMFQEVFDRITKEFLRSDAHGLDANLSIRIRHGTLTGQLRGHFERYHLVTPRDTRRDVYEQNTHWLDSSSMPADLAESVDDRLQQFSRAVDRAIEEVKDEWLQIRTADRPGLFDYEFKPSELAELAKLAVTAKDVGQFADIIFQALWRRTEVNSKNARQKIQEELHATLTSRLFDLEGDLQKIHGGFRRTRLRTMIEQCRGTLQQTLESIAGWFDIDATRSSPDYRFDLLAETCIASIRRSLSDDRARRIKSTVQALPSLRGRLFDHLFALTHILLDNAVRHGRPDIDITLAIERDDASIRVRVTNGITPAQNEALSGCLRELELRTTLGPTTELHREGGTGFFKLGRLIRVDLGTSDYDVSLDIVDYQIITSVRINARELFA